MTVPAKITTGLVPSNMVDAMRLAEMMATAKLVPLGLQKSPADCLMVIQQAIRWEMDPFAVAQECSVIQGKLMYSGKLVAAVINSRGALAERLSYSYQGEGQNRSVIVSGKLQGEFSARDVAVHIKDAKTAAKVWQTQPDQQLAYHGARVWARRHMPELMLGVWSPEEFGEDINGDKRINPITPGTPEEIQESIPAPDDPDRVPPQSDPTTRELPRMQQAPVYKKLQDELRSFKTLEDLQKWKNLPETANRVAMIREDWRQTVRGQIKERLMEFRGAQKMQETSAPEADWLTELDAAYQKCEDAASFFDVDKKMFLPIIPTVSPAERSKAQEIRQEHFTRINEEVEIE